MASQVGNGIGCIEHCWGVYHQNSIVNNARVDDWIAELVIIASNDAQTGQSFY